MENERADARRDEHLRAEWGQEKIKHIFSFKLALSGGIDNHARLTHNLLNMVSHYTSSRHVLVVRLDKLTVSLLFVVWIREFHSWPDDFIMVSIAESKRT